MIHLHFPTYELRVDKRRSEYLVLFKERGETEECAVAGYDNELHAEQAARKFPEVYQVAQQAGLGLDLTSDEPNFVNEAGKMILIRSALRMSHNELHAEIENLSQPV